jgi:hypothetical protein
VIATGRKASEETRRILSLSHIGIKHSEETKQKMSESHIGTKHSEETISKMSESALRLWKNPEYKERFIGEKHHAWCGGPFPYPEDWTETLKESIRQRDGYRCRLCCAVQEECLLPVHHIDYNKDNCDPKNLITLCKSCHMKTNFNRKKWIDFFNKFRRILPETHRSGPFCSSFSAQGHCYGD